MTKKACQIHNFWATVMILGSLEFSNQVPSAQYAQIPKMSFWNAQNWEKRITAMLYYCSLLHKLQAQANTTKRPSRWSNLGFLESLGSKEWENHIARFGFWLFVKQCHPSEALTL